MSQAGRQRSSTARRGRAIQEIQHDISRLVRQVQAPALGQAIADKTGIRLGGPYFQVLTRVVRDGPLNLSEMARQLSSDISTLSRHVAALEKKGLVRRERDPSDGRAYFLSATPKGEEVFTALLTEWVASIDDVVSDWSNDDVEQFASLFSDFVERMTQFVMNARQGTETDYVSG